MCHLLTFAVPGEVDTTRRRQGLLVERFGNQGSGHEYVPSMIAYSVTDGGCSCGLVYPDNFSETPEEIESALRKKYGKKGWSQSKIERAVTDAIRNVEQKSPLRKDVEALLVNHLTCFRELQFILHWHSGSFISEKFQVRQRIELKVSKDFRFESIKEDIRYMLTPQKG